jgi:hypothetical protein
MELAVTLPQQTAFGSKSMKGIIRSPRPTRRSVCLDVKEPHHGDKVLIREGNLCEALVDFELSKFLVDGSSPLGILHSIPESLRDSGVCECDGESEVRGFDCADDDIVVRSE